MRRAVIDVGSNSVLLLVAESLDRHRWTPILETSAVTGLGQGTKDKGVLSERGMNDTLLALDRAYAAARAHGAEQITAAATMACRIARNTEEFLDRAARQGTPVTILSGDDEAHLGFMSVAEDQRFCHAKILSIIDVGGHSTELITASRSDQEWKILFKRSFPIGALGLRDGVLQEQSPSLSARLKATVEIDEVIGLEYLPGRAGKVVTLGATGTNLVSIRERLEVWNPQMVHGATLDYEDISRAVSLLCSMDDLERANLIGMEKGRERTLPAGALILERFLHACRVSACLVSVRGWRHALLENNYGPFHWQDNLGQTSKSLL